MSSGLINLMARAHYASFSIVAAMGVVHFQQISNHLVSNKGPLEGVLRSLRSRLTEKWMNVVLDLNGLLCVKGPWQRMQPLPKLRFVTFGAKVGPKAVTVRG